MILERDLSISNQEKKQLKKDLNELEAELKFFVNEMMNKNNEIKVLQEKASKNEENLNIVEEEIKVQKTMYSNSPQDFDNLVKSF